MLTELGRFFHFFYFHVAFFLTPMLFLYIISFLVKIHEIMNYARDMHELFFLGYLADFILKDKHNTKW